MKRVTYILFSLILLNIGCGQESKKETDQKPAVKVSENESDAKEPAELHESYNEEDIPANDYLTERLRPIRSNFKRINTITEWSGTDTVCVPEYMNGTMAIFYYSKDRLEKIILHKNSHKTRNLNEYYLLNGQLSFVFEKAIETDSQNTGSQVKGKKDFVKSGQAELCEIVEDKSYFENGTLLHQINNMDCGAPFSDDYLLEEQIRIIAEYRNLLQLNRNKH